MKIKIVMLGDGGVGKSCLTIQFCKNTFVAEYDPTIENMYTRQLTIDEKPCVLDILDTAGQEEYSAMQNQYIRSGEGFALIFSLANRRSFNEISEFREAIINVKETDKIPMVLIGNKCDLPDRDVSTVELIDLARTYNCPCFETSAKTRKNVDESFIALVTEIFRYRLTTPQEPAKPNSKRKSSRSDRCLIL